MDMRESEQYPGFLEKNLGSVLREELDRDFQDDDQDKLKFVTAQLEAKKSQLKNLGKIDSTNHTDQDMDRIVNYPDEIAELEVIQDELKAIIGNSIAEKEKDSEPKEIGNMDEQSDIIDHEESVN